MLISLSFVHLQNFHVLFWSFSWQHSLWKVQIDVVPHLDRVALCREAVERVITCVQDFLRDHWFTQKNFFSDSGVAMLNEAVAVADIVIVSEDFKPWFVFGCNQQVESDLQICQEKVAMAWNASRDKSERWFSAQSAGFPSASTSAGRQGVRIMKFVEEGQVENFAVPEPIASSSHCEKSTDWEQEKSFCVVWADVLEAFWSRQSCHQSP